MRTNEIKLTSEERKAIEEELMQFAEVVVNDFLKRLTEEKEKERKKYAERIVF